MCLAKSSSSSASTTKLVEQLNKSNALLSNEKTAATTSEKTSTKRTVSSLRVPLKTNTGTTGVNTTDDTTTGLNIPV